MLGALRPYGYSCLMLGYGRGDTWIANAMIYSDGLVLLRRLEPNPTPRSGLYAKLSRFDAEHAFTVRGLFPTRVTGLVAPAVQFHLGPPLLVFAGLATWTCFWPLARRRARRRRGLCVACGYDLRGSSSGTCPECGHATITSATA